MMSSRSGRLRRPSRVPVAAVLALLATLGLYAAMVATERGRTLDARGRFARLWRTDIVEAIGSALLAAVVPFGTIVAVGLAVALLGGRRRQATFVAAFGSLVLTNVIVQVAKSTFEYADPLGGEAFRHSQGAFPSGHAAIATSAAFALIIVAPRRRAVAIGAGGFALAVNLSLLVIGWHYASDVIAAALVAFAVASLCRFRIEPRSGKLEVAVLFATLALSGGALALGALLDGRLIAGQPVGLSFGAIGIVAATIGVVAGFMASSSTAQAAGGNGDPPPGGHLQPASVGPDLHTSSV